MQTYTGTISFPAAVQIIETTDPPTATNFNTAPEGLVDRTNWLKNKQDRLRVYAYTATDDTFLFGGAILSGGIATATVTALNGEFCEVWVNYDIYTVTTNGVAEVFLRITDITGDRDYPVSVYINQSPATFQISAVADARGSGSVSAQLRFSTAAGEDAYLEQVRTFVRILSTP